MYLKFQTLNFTFFLLQHLPSLLEIQREHMGYQKMDESVPSRGRVQLGKNSKIWRTDINEHKQYCCEKTELGLLKAPMNSCSKYSLKVKGAPLGRKKSWNSVFLNKVIFINIEWESQSQLDLCKIQPEDILVSSKWGLMELHLDAETFGIFVAIGILGAMWHLNAIMRKKMSSVNCGILCYLAILKSRCETHGWDRHYPVFLRGFLNLNKKKFNFIVKVRSVKKYKYKMFSLEQIIYLKIFCLEMLEISSALFWYFFLFWLGHTFSSQITV